jgi:U3 small nucleolar RNA-associated protein 7
MITLDPDFIGSIAPLPKLTEVGDDGRTGIPYSQLPRYERLRISGKADEFEDADNDSEDNGEDDGEGSKKRAKSEKEKKKMRGKKKSLKRFVMPPHSHGRG